MKRIINYDISDSPLNTTTPQTIKGFLSAKAYSVQNLKLLKQDPDGILLNGMPAHMNAPLSKGDRLTVCISENDNSEKIIPVKLPLDIVYEDEDILVLNKPAGMPIHPSMKNYDNTLANALAYYYQEQGKPFIFRCINRLDRDTSGLTIVAKHYVSAGILGMAVAAKSKQHLVAENDLLQHKASANPLPAPFSILYLQREYLAIVDGIVIPPDGTIDAPLGRKPGSLIERHIDPENGETAVTHYHVLESKKDYSLVSLQLETGRTHQIRVHMKYIGHPLLGDYLYNDDNKKQDLIIRQALHSHALSFLHPITREHMHFEVPMPDDMQKLFPDKPY